MRIRSLAFSALTLLSSSAAFGATTYNWITPTTGDYQIAANWSSVPGSLPRTTPATDDILVWDGSVTPGTVTVTNIPSGTVQATPLQTVGKLIFQNSADIIWTSNGVPPGPAVANIQPSAAAADVLQVSANSRFTIGGTNDIVLRMASGSTATINGTIRFASPSVSTAVLHRLIPGAATGIIFASGSKFENTPDHTTSNTNVFGSGGASSTLLFQSGSALYNGGTATGPGIGPGGSPTNQANVAFDPGSLVYQWGTALPTASPSARTYGDLTFDIRQNNPHTFNTGVGLCTVAGNLLVKSTSGSAGSLGVLRWSAAGQASAPAANLIVAGNFTVQSGGLYEDLSANATSQIIQVAGNVSWLGTGFRMATNNTRTLTLNGASAQTIEISEFGEITVGVPTRNTLYNLIINNAAGVTNVGAASVRVRNAVTLTSGNFAGPITLEAATTVSGAGLLTGSVERIVNGAATGTSTLPIADVPVSFIITAAGSGSGSVTGSTTAVAASGLPSGVVGINRTWTLTPATITGYTATLVFTYKAGDIGGATESALKAAHFNGSTWDVLNATSTVNTTTKTVTVTGVTSLSPWTLVDPTAGVSDWKSITD